MVSNLYKGVEEHGRSIRVWFMLDGKRCREVLHDKAPTQRNLAAAAKLRSEIVELIKRGLFRYEQYFPNSPRGKQSKRSPSNTFETLGDKWLASKKKPGFKPATIRTYKSRLKFWTETFGDKPLSQIDSFDITDALAKREWHPKTYNNVLIPVRGVFGAALKGGYIDIDPTEDLENCTVEETTPNPLTSEECERVISYMRETYNGQVANYFAFAIYTGLRPCEIIELRWRDVDANKEIVSVSRAKVCGKVQATKTRAKWPVHLLPPALKALLAQRQYTFAKGPDATVFENPATQRAWADESRQRKLHWAPTLHKLGIMGRDAYQTRHTFATMLLMRGLMPSYISSQLGHASIAMVMKVYAKWIPGTAEDNAEATRAKAMFALDMPHKSTGTT